jgi:nucleotide-binding universal stress UspA family protein
MDLAIGRILVPLDFSAHSEAALHYAVALAARLGASLDVLHVVDDPFGSGAWASESAALPHRYIEELYQNLVEEGERQLAKYRSVPEKSRVAATFTVRSGQPAASIVDYADAIEADLIVMGTHGRTGLKHTFMGSVAERVVRHARCPVVTLRGEAEGETTQREEIRTASARR